MARQLAPQSLEAVIESTEGILASFFYIRFQLEGRLSRSDTEVQHLNAKKAITLTWPWLTKRCCRTQQQDKKNNQLEQRRQYWHRSTSCRIRMESDDSRQQTSLKRALYQTASNVNDSIDTPMKGVWSSLLHDKINSTPPDALLWSGSGRPTPPFSIGVDDSGPEKARQPTNIDYYDNCKAVLDAKQNQTNLSHTHKFGSSLACVSLSSSSSYSSIPSSAPFAQKLPRSIEIHQCSDHVTEGRELIKLSGRRLRSNSEGSITYYREVLRSEKYNQCDRLPHVAVSMPQIDAMKRLGQSRRRVKDGDNRIWIRNAKCLSSEPWEEELNECISRSGYKKSNKVEEKIELNQTQNNGLRDEAHRKVSANNPIAKREQEENRSAICVNERSKKDGDKNILGTTKGRNDEGEKATEENYTKVKGSEDHEGNMGQAREASEEDKEDVESNEAKKLIYENGELLEEEK
ncbi:unnamed protein product, partial [Protopolystoma xenopodis]